MDKLLTVDQYISKMEKTIKNISGKYSTWEVFNDFLILASHSLMNSCIKEGWQEREDTYLKTINKYNKEEQEEFVKLLSYLTLALEVKFDDVLGSLFMRLGLGNKWKGQFFTPYNVSLAMAKMLIDEKAGKEHIKKNGYISICEPCVGGGANLIAAAETFKDCNINYQKFVCATAIDIDIRAVYMAYIQLSLIGLPAVIIHGNTITLETWGAYPTPFYVLGRWDYRLYGQSIPKNPNERLKKVINSIKLSLEKQEKNSLLNHK